MDEREKTRIKISRLEYDCEQLSREQKFLAELVVDTAQERDAALEELAQVKANRDLALSQIGAANFAQTEAEQELAQVRASLGGKLGELSEKLYKAREEAAAYAAVLQSFADRTCKEHPINECPGSDEKKYIGPSRRVLEAYGPGILGTVTTSSNPGTPNPSPEPIGPGSIVQS